MNSEYAEEFQQETKSEESVRFYESDEQSIPLSIWKSSAIQEKDVEKSETDTCIYVISRQAGEGADRKLNENEYGLAEIERVNI